MLLRSKVTTCSSADIKITHRSASALCLARHFRQSADHAGPAGNTHWKEEYWRRAATIKAAAAAASMADDEIILSHLCVLDSLSDVWLK